MAASVDWNGIHSEIGNAIINDVHKNIRADIETMAREFESTMDFEIADNPRLTIGESERIAMVPFQQSGAPVIQISKSSKGVTIHCKVFFSFDGDKTLVSLSPNKSVYDLIALFNNGYASNNVRPDAPIRGMWHGRELVIKPRSRPGAHFIGRAIQEFKNWCATYYPDYKISFKVDPNYSTST